MSEQQGIHLLAISKYRKVDLEDGQALFESITAHEDMKLSGKIQGREFKVDAWYGKMFKILDENNYSPDVHVVLLGKFTGRERKQLIKYFADFLEVPHGVRYDNLVGDVICYPGGAETAERLYQYMAQEDLKKQLKFKG